MKRSVIRAFAGIIASASIIASVPAASGAEYGWQGAAGASPYYQADNTYADGIMVIDGIAYDFGPDGHCRGTYTGFGIKNLRRRYYVNGIIYNKGWLELPSGMYYFDKDGNAAQGIVTINGRQYNFTGSGKLITAESKNALYITADKNSVFAGRKDYISFTVNAANITGSAVLKNDITLHRYKNGSWYTVKRDKNMPSVTDELMQLTTIGNVGGNTGYKSTHTIKFCPDEYLKSAESGRYRAEISVITESGRVVPLRYEFEIISAADISTKSDSYNLLTTSKIDFTAYLNVDSRVYAPEICELQFFSKDKNKWILVEPQSGKDIIADTVFAPAGAVVNTYLDLTRYSRSSMKTGRYRAVIGENLTYEFELKTPFDVKVTEIESADPKVRQIKITVTNENYADIKINGYGELLRYEKGSWKKLKLKKDASLDTSMTVPARHRWNMTMLLTDYYSYRNLKNGYYCMKFPAENGGFIYAYFTLE